MNKIWQWYHRYNITQAGWHNFWDDCNAYKPLAADAANHSKSIKPSWLINTLPRQEINLPTMVCWNVMPMYILWLLFLYLQVKLKMGTKIFASSLTPTSSSSSSMKKKRHFHFWLCVIVMIPNVVPPTHCCSTTEKHFWQHLGSHGLFRSQRTCNWQSIWGA